MNAPVYSGDMQNPEDGTESERVTIEQVFAVRKEDVPGVLEAHLRLLGRISHKELSLKSLPLCPDELSIDSGILRRFGAVR